MRKLTDHVANPVNDKLEIVVEDSPGAGGANHLYMIRGYDSTSNASDPFVARYGNGSDHSTILFQNGPISEAGVNGVTHEALLAILIDRLRSFQAGPHACVENKVALHHLVEALDWLKRRTTKHMARGVEGMMEP